MRRPFLYVKINNTINGFIFMLIVMAWSGIVSAATISGIYSHDTPTTSAQSNCSVFISGGSIYEDFVGTNSYSATYQPVCKATLPTAYVPTTGPYQLRSLFLCSEPSCVNGNNYLSKFSTNTVQIDSTKPLSQQNLSFTGSSRAYTIEDTGGHFFENMCILLVDAEGNSYIMPSIGLQSGCSNATILKPVPPTPVGSCTINSGSDLNVTLGNIDRAQLVTVPGTGTPRHYQIPVNCTGAPVEADMKIMYTPLTVSGTDVVKSSSNGLGITIIYNGQPVPPSTSVTQSYIVGSNVIDLAFETVRDPSVVVGDVPTGAFTASATVVLTQQ